MTTTEITATGTYTVRLARQARPKDWHRSVELVKAAGGTYDDWTRTWTVVEPLIPRLHDLQRYYDAEVTAVEATA